MDLRSLACLLVLPGGAAAIGWQLLWQHHTSLALGVSAQATALVVTTTMAGMTAGALLATRCLPKAGNLNPWIIYAALEAVAALSGHGLGWLREPISRLDTAAFRVNPFFSSLILVLAPVIALGPATLAIGATVPVLGLLARRLEIPVSRLYALNTGGAALGAGLVPFLFLPLMGVNGCQMTVAGLQMMGALGCWAVGPIGALEAPTGPGRKTEREPLAHPCRLAFVTGLTTFLLEVTWFRTIRSAWLSTVDSFAIVLFAFLIALAVGAALVPMLRRRKMAVVSVLGWAGLLILPASLAMAHFDGVRIPVTLLDWKPAIWLGLALVTMGPPVTLLGVGLPWLLDEAGATAGWGRLYAWNTIGCALGACGAAWLLLPLLGPGWMAWGTGILLAVLFLRGRGAPWRAAVLGVLAWLTVPQDRLTGASGLLRLPHRVVAREHGPDVTTAVIETPRGRALMIDGYAASGEFGALTGYMDAMGRLPMLLHDQPRDALVICVGTGQTARALREENAVAVTAVDVNPAVFRFLEHFPANQGILADPRVTAITMDGRAWLRRTDRMYDVITLEPMPPLFAGTNALYSVEFYRLIAARLRPGGMAAQWFPMHLLSPENARSVAATFLEVFPEAVLWIDPSNTDPQGTPQQGVLLGCNGSRDWQRWPGFDRPARSARPLSAEICRSAMGLGTADLRAYGSGARLVTDDNLLLTHGRGRHLRSVRGNSPAGETMKAIRALQLTNLRW
jgi:spermidine synthase